MDSEKMLYPVSAEDEVEIDLLDLFRALMQRAWLIISFFVIGAVAAGVFTTFFVTPQYQATSMIYVYSKTTSITSLADLQIGSQLAVDFQIVATTREIMDNVIEKLDLNTNYEELLKTVQIENPKGSHILKITVTNPSPEKAAQISNTIADELRARIADVMNTDEPSVVDQAYVPSKPASPSLKKNVAIGGIGCMLLVVTVLIVIYLLDDTIKTGDDVKKYLNLNVLEEIPIERGQKARKSG